MKYRIFILPLLLGPVSASALSFSVYYDRNGNCDTLCNFPYVGEGCCPDQNVVTAQAIAEKFMDLAAGRDEEFSGFKLTKGTETIEIMDPSGNLLTGKQINALNLDSSVTLRTTNTCAGTAARNDNNVCVYGFDTATQDYTYVDFTNGDAEGGYEVWPDGLGGTPKGNSCFHSKFKLKIHWCPPKHGAYTGNWGNGRTGWDPPSVPAGFGYPELWPEDCESGDNITDNLEYEWVDRSNAGTTCTHGFLDSDGKKRCAVYRRNNVIIDQLDVPTGRFADWTLRGFYLRSEDLWTPPTGCTDGTNYNYDCFIYWGNRNYFAKWLVTTKNNTYGMARLGLPKNNTNGTISTETGYIPLNDKSENNWGNTRWGIWDCSKTDEEAANTTYHLYAGWARNCAPDDEETCSLVIKRTGLHELNDKGDAFYQSTCPDGSQPEGESGSSYNPTCTEAPKNISYAYDKYQTDGGGVVSCTGGPVDGTCSTGGELILGSSDTLSCGGNNVFFGWQTSGVHGGIHSAGETISCSRDELGSYTPVTITGILCDCGSTTSSPIKDCNALCGGTVRDMQPGFTLPDDIGADDDSNNN